MATSNTTRVLLGVGIGCVSLFGTCCLSAGALVLFRSSSYQAAGRAHAETFLAALQRQDPAAAFTAAEYMGDTRLHSLEQFRSCLAATVLGDMTSYTCSDVDSSIVGDDGADVTCTVVSPSHGTVDVTIGINSPDSTPYLGFVWFADGVWMGDAWHGDECARWSGRESYDPPPAGRVRP